MSALELREVSSLGESFSVLLSLMSGFSLNFAGSGGLNGQSDVFRNSGPLSQLLASSRKDHLPEWKLSQYSGDPLQWHEWFGQFKSAIDSAPLSDDVKLTYLKTLVAGKAKVAIAEFAYCGAMYKDALKTLERKFGQPQAVVTAYLDKLANVPPVKMHNSESIISYSATVSSLVGVFRSLNYNQGPLVRFPGVQFPDREPVVE